MSSLNKFALEVASLLDKIANSVPETASVPGAPFHLSIIEMGKSAKRHLEKMRKHAQLEKTGLEPLSLLLGAGIPAIGGGLGWLAKQVPKWGDEAAMATVRKMSPEDISKGLLSPMQNTPEGATALKELLETHIRSPAGKGLLEEATLAGKEEATQLGEKAYWDLVKGMGLAGGGVLGGKMLFDEPRQQSNLPQIVRYG
jgi:hypothetical protein